MEKFSQYSCKDRAKYPYDFKKSDIRRWYQRDIDQIIHSTAFRKLQKKSQLLSEQDPRSRSRMIHTLEVSRIALEISGELGLDKELTEAIALGHDLGTSPYGCIGNRYLAEKTGDTFCHEETGVLMLETLAQMPVNDEDDKEKASVYFSNNKKSYMDYAPSKSPFPLKISQIKNERSEGYFTYHISPEILDGVATHGAYGTPATLEGQVVKYSDNIAYLSQDIDDLFFARIIAPNEYIRYAGINLNIDEERSMTWEEIDAPMEAPSLKGAFSNSRGIRLNTMIKRFVNYNLKMLSKGELRPMESKILSKSIPMLEIDKGLQFVIDFIWRFIEEQYKHPLIKTSNCLQQAKIDQLWNILDVLEEKDNRFYINFLESLKCDSRFRSKDEKWRKAYFISHLSYSEVDLIIDSYQRRDFNFEIDIEEQRHGN